MNRKQQIIDLWKTCFNDSEEFTDFFFSEVYKDENEFTIEKEGNVVSALQAIPYIMDYYGEEIPMSYIYGACTLPAERGIGHMMHLVNESLQIMKTRDVALAVTIPASPQLFDLYRKSGFTETFTYSTDSFILPDPPIAKSNLTIIEPEVPSTQDVYNFFNAKMKERNCSVLHSYDNFLAITREYNLMGSHIVAAINDNEEVKGLAFLITDNDDNGKPSVRVTEILYENLQVKFFMLQEILKQYGGTSIDYRCVTSGMKNRPYGMAKVLDKERMIHHWLHTHKDSKYTRESLNSMEIEPLTQLLLGYKTEDAYMSLMFDQ